MLVLTGTSCFTLQRVDAILQFIIDYTVDVEGVGHVCRLVFSAFFLIHNLGTIYVKALNFNDKKL